jgi:NAD(P)-dependent dehydrogenase (short-subunit alcohol dehydrogenase family)
MSDTLRNRVVLITGATGALGSVVTREFAQTQAWLALTGQSTEKLERLMAENELSGENILCKTCDLTQPSDVQDLLDTVVTHFGRLDVALNTVGGWSGGKPVEEVSVEEWEHMLSLNLRSAFLLSRAALPPMLKLGWGRIVHVSSKTAVDPRAKQAGYAVAKMALITLTEVIAAEVKGSGVTANVILPSIIDTPDNRKSMPKADTSKWVPPEQIAATMRFLCSEKSASINGARIPIYGKI